MTDLGRSVVPVPDTARMPAFWAAVAESRLAFPRCRSCGTFCWYPEPLCPTCGAGLFDWTPVAAPPQVFSWTVIRRALEPRLAHLVPFASVIVEFADAPGVRFVTRLVDALPEDLRIGQFGCILYRDLGYPGMTTGIVAPLLSVTV